MTRAQRETLLTALFLDAAMFLYPPVQLPLKGYWGHIWLLSLWDSDPIGKAAVIDFVALGAQIEIVTFVAATVYLLAADIRRK